MLSLYGPKLCPYKGDSASGQIVIQAFRLPEVENGALRFDGQGVGGDRAAVAEQAARCAAGRRSPGARRHFYIPRTGAPWRDVPERYGPYATVFNRYNLWVKRGVWLRVFEALSTDAPDEAYHGGLIHLHRIGPSSGSGRKRTSDGEEALEAGEDRLYAAAGGGPPRSGHADGGGDPAAGDQRGHVL